VAVNVDPRESDVASLTAAELNTNLEGTGVTVATSEAELEAAIETNRTGRSFWQYFMIAGLILLVVESLFADRLRKRKRARSKQPDPMPEIRSGAKDA